MKEQEAIEIGRRVAVYVSLQLGVARDTRTGEWGILTYLPTGTLFLEDAQVARGGLALLREAHPDINEDEECKEVEVLNEEESARILRLANR